MHSIEYILAASFISVVAIVAVIELISLATRRAAKAAGATPGVLRDLTVYGRLFELIIASFAVLQITGYSSVLTTITFSGIAALAASLALQSTLSNIISGMLLLSDGAIHLSDNIEYSGVKGEIVRIGLRNTWIRQADGSIAVVSNSQLSGGPLVNHSAVERLRKKYKLG